MNRLVMILTGAAWVLAMSTAWFAAAEPARPTQPLNFVFFLIDDLGWTDLGCFGSDLYETPNIDRLAREGMRFTNAYAACTVCSPTRAAVMTGKYPARLHVTDWIAGHERPYAKLRIPDWTKYLPHEQVTIAEALKPAGYFTGHVGKWHLGSKGFWPTDQGFDVNIAGHEAGSPPSYYWPYERGGRRILNLELTKQTEGQYLTDRLGDEAVQILRAHSREPFFLYLPTYQVHMPLDPKKEYVPKYQARIRPGLKHDHPGYAAMIQSMDEYVGKVLRALDELKIADRTVVFFTSDNGGLSHLWGEKRGPTNNAPLRLGKGSAYEGGVRVPLIVRWPGAVRPNSTCHEPVLSIDYYPTILELAGVKGDAKHNADLDGVSLVPLLGDPAAKLQRDAIFWHYPHYHPGGATPYGAVRAGDWKLIEFYEDMHVELYNLKEDIGERNDLAARMPDKVAELRDRLHRWREAVGAQMPTPNPQYDSEKDRQAAQPKSKPAAKKSADKKSGAKKSSGEKPAGKKPADNPPAGKPEAEKSQAEKSALAEPVQSQSERASLHRRPNIVLIMADDLGRADLGAYGQKVVPTPNLDRLAAQGMKFNHAYAGCSVCAPSRSVLMTGLHMGHTPVRTNPGGVSIRAEDVTVAQRLKALGYATGGFGKWGLGDVGTPGVPEKHGFDLFFGYYHQVHAHYYFPEYLYRNSQRVLLEGNAGFAPELKHPPDGAYPPIDPATGKHRQFSHDVILRETLDYIRGHKDGPFFCYAAWTIPHGRWHILADDPAWALFKDKPWPDDIKVVAAMNVMLDRSVGQVLELLANLGLEENTVVLFTSDNGGARRLEGTLDCVGPLRGQKGTLYEGGLRVPLLVRWPGKTKPGSTSDLPVYFADIAPTLMEIAGASLGETDGVSLVPTLTGQGEQRKHEYLYWESAHNAKGLFAQAVRWGKWKAVRQPKRPIELFDLSRDEAETTDVASIHPDVVQQIQRFMEQAHQAPPPQIEPTKPPGARWR